MSLSIANKKIPVVFRYLVKTNKDVMLIGTFTNWKEKIGMVKSDGDHVAIVDLPEGEHHYKFVVDGKWEHDPNQTCVDDNFNGKNNVVVVKKSDFEVMDALEMDSIKSEAERAVSSK
jgi:5'-AMP-activated protein kinase regulatory beta subunit